MPHLLKILVLVSTILTQSNAEAVTDALWSFEDYTRSWTVGTKAGNVVPLRLNAPQRHVYRIMQESQGDQGTRIRLLKTRRMGASTMFTAMAQHTAQTRAHCHSLSIADKEALPMQWLRNAKLWLKQTPGSIRPHAGATNANEIWYDHLSSRYYIGSEGGKNPGMGDNVRFLHLSEIGYWPNPDRLLKDLNPAVPKNDNTVVVVQESTGDMAGSWWEEAWWAAKRGEDDYTAIFVPWSMDPDNVMNASDVIALTDDEKSRTAAFGLSREQIAWFRWIIRNEYKGDEEQARSRYPQTPGEAFLSPGRAGIPPTISNRHRGTAKEPLRRVTLIEIDGRVEAVEYHGSGPCWWVWENPNPRIDYCIGADVAENSLSDQKDERSARDNSTAGVLNRVFLTSAAEYVGSVDPGEFHPQLRLAHRWYNEAWLMPEINNCGWAVVEGLRGMRHLFRREGPQDALGIHPTAAYGWKTTTSTRDYLIDSFIADCWNIPNELIEVPDSFMWEGKFHNFSKRLSDEERTFVTNNKGKREHRAGMHDDVLFCWMLALMCHKKCPRQQFALTPPPPESMYDKYLRENAEKETQVKRW